LWIYHHFRNKLEEIPKKILFRLAFFVLKHFVTLEHALKNAKTRIKPENNVFFNLFFINDAI